MHIRTHLFCILVLVLIQISLSSAIGCECIETIPFEDRVRASLLKATELFTGKVISIETVIEPMPAHPERLDDLLKVTFSVNWSWKSSQSKLVVYTGSGRGDCGVEFHQGKEYIVYAFGSSNRVETSICTETKLLERASRDLAVLGKPKYKHEKSK